MSSRPRSPLDDLRLAIDCLPLRTREAMLEGIRSNPIVVGAYSDKSGGVCPMLAAHRHGGRAGFGPFAHAWDRFAGARRPRRATGGEVRMLVAAVQASILAEADLAAAIRHHQALARDRRSREAQRIGRAWLAERHEAGPLVSLRGG
jgi:hypothetical protein